MALSFSRLSSSLRYSAHYQPWFTSCRSRCLSTVRVKSPTDAQRKSLMPFSAIPGPKGSFSNMFDYTRRGGIPNIVEILTKRFEKFGPIYREDMFGGRQLVNISDVDEIEKVLRVDSFPMRPGFDVVEKIHEERDYCTGLMSNEHGKWISERTLLAPKLLRPKEVSKFLPGFSEVARDFVKSVSHHQQADKTVVDLERHLFYWIMESSCTFLFDQRLGLYSNRPSPDAIAFVNSARDVTYNMGKFVFGNNLYKYFRTLTYNRFEKAVDDLYTIGQNIVNTILTETREGQDKTSSGEERSLFDHISASNELSPQMVVNILIALMAAGIDTTSTSVLWLVYMLARHPETQEKLYEELKSVLGTEGELISNKTIGSLPYLKACFKESSRLNHLAIIVPRRYDQDIDVLGYNIPAGMDIMLFTQPTNIAESYYGENAKEFVPERWLLDETGKKGAYRPFASIPFGYGVRMCLGRRVAEAQVYAFFSQLLLSYRLEYAGRTELKQRLSGILNKPDKPVIVKFIPR